MRAKMPKDLEALLFQLENADDIKKVQDEWAEYQAANENYEKNYPVQFANLVEANLKFKENKSIPTPAEQMQDFKERIKTRIDDLLEEKQHHDTYELEEANDNINQREAEYLQQSKELKLTFDTQTPVASKQETAKSKSGHDIDKSQELGISWLKQHQQQEEPTVEAPVIQMVVKEANGYSKMKEAVIVPQHVVERPRNRMRL